VIGALSGSQLSRWVLTSSTPTRLTRSSSATFVAEISEMWFSAISMSFFAIFADAVRLAAVATDDWFGAVRLPTSATLLAVLLVVRLQSGTTTAHTCQLTTDWQQYWALVNNNNKFISSRQVQSVKQTEYKQRVLIIAYRRLPESYKLSMLATYDT